MLCYLIGATNAANTVSKPLTKVLSQEVQSRAIPSEWYTGSGHSWEMGEMGARERKRERERARERERERERETKRKRDRKKERDSGRISDKDSDRENENT